MLKRKWWFDKKCQKHAVGFPPNQSYEWLQTISRRVGSHIENSYAYSTWVLDEWRFLIKLCKSRHLFGTSYKRLRKVEHRKMDLLTILEKTVSPGKFFVLKTKWVLTSTGILNFLAITILQILANNYLCYNCVLSQCFRQGRIRGISKVSWASCPSKFGRFHSFSRLIIIFDLADRCFQLQVQDGDSMAIIELRFAKNVVFLAASHSLQSKSEYRTTAWSLKWYKWEYITISY